MAWPRSTHLLVALLVCAACECSSKPPARDGGIRGQEPPSVAATLELGPEGGVVAITDRMSALYGANLVVPAEALPASVEISLAEGSALPAGSNAFGVGPTLQIEPLDLPLGAPGVAELPLPDGLDPDQLTAARWDESTARWEILPTTQLWEDPAEMRGGYLRFEVTGGGIYRALYHEPQIVSVLNDGSGQLVVSLGAARFTRYDPVPPRAADLRVPVEPLASAPVLLLPGEYVLHATFEGETTPRCARLEVVDPVTTVPVEVSFSDFTPPCPLPAVRVMVTPNEVAPGAMATINATATSTAGSTLTWYWTSTGGAVFGELMGTATSGQMVQTTWTAPMAPGDYYLGMLAVSEEGWFAQGSQRITVRTRNQLPMITQLTGTPVVVGPGLPDGTRNVAELAGSGVVRFRAAVSDLDGDDVAVYWTYRQPGDWYDIETGAKLGIDPDTGLVVWPDSGAPYVEHQILYMAPPARYVDTLSRGWWMPASAIASDGELRDRAFEMVAVTRQAVEPTDAGPDTDAGPGRRDAGHDAGMDAGPVRPPVVGRCVSVVDAECEMYVGSAYTSDVAALESACTGMGWTWTEGFACPESGAIGACYRFHMEPREVATVYYGPSPTTMELNQLTNDCRMLPVAEGGPGTWVRPYRAPR